MNTPKENQLFSRLPLSQAMLKNLDLLGYQAMTPIQSKSLPLILDGKDVIAKAKTGSGKTAAFGPACYQKSIRVFSVPNALFSVRLGSLATRSQEKSGDWRGGFQISNWSPCAVVSHFLPRPIL